MKFIFLFSFLLINTPLLFGQDKIYFDDKWKETDESNAKYYRQVTLDNKLFFIQDYFISNQLQFEGFSRRKVEPFDLEGNATWYYEDGSLAQKGTYKNNKLIGAYLVYYPNGQLKAKGNYSDGGILHGEYVEYFSNGGIANQANFRYGKKDGTHTKYFSKDKMEFKIDYKNDLVHGNYEKYNYYDGSLLYKGSALNNRQDGECYEYYYTKIIRKYTVKNGYLHGAYHQYTKEGEEIIHGIFDEGIPIEYYHTGNTDDGTIVSKMELIDSIEVWKTYLDDKLVAESFYTKGVKSGIWKIYTKKGTLFETQDYSVSKCINGYRQPVQEKFAPFFFMYDRFDLTEGLFNNEDCENIKIDKTYPNANLHPLFFDFRMHQLLKAANKAIDEQNKKNSNSTD